jgi:2'-hydroxyisoflavone reductase
VHHRLLILGGTGFIGPHFVFAARERGFAVTLFNRGRTNPHFFREIEILKGDRDGDLSALVGRTWDTVIDTTAFLPRLVTEATRQLRTAVGQYVLISTISVYRPRPAPRDEESEVVKIADPTTETITLETYGALKALCEDAAEAVLPGRVLKVRVGDIVGPGDPTDRFTYWPVRIARGGEVLAPGTPYYPIQYIDVRDLAEWTISMIDAGRTGVYNVIGPCDPLPMGEFLAVCKRVTGTRARITFVDAAFLRENNLVPSTELPLWLPGLGPVENQRARDSGLRFRPVQVTLNDTLAWWRTQPAERQAKLRAGIAPDRELEILAKFASKPRGVCDARENSQSARPTRDEVRSQEEDPLIRAEQLLQRSFACPYFGPNPEYLALLVVEHARYVGELFLERDGSLIEARSDGLVPLLWGWRSSKATYKTVWDLAFGGIYSGLSLKDDNDLRRRAGALALRLHACGQDGEWALDLDPPVSFRFDRWLLPAADRLHVSAVAGKVSIDSWLGGVSRRSRFDRTGDTWDGDNACPLPVVSRADVRAIVLPEEALQGREFERFRGELSRHDLAATVAEFDAALSLIGDYAGTYLPWVGCVLRYLVPLKWKLGLASSSSSDNRAPGVVLFANDHSCFALAEVLVHEASHQYFFVLNRRGTIDDGSDTNLYYSPFREMDRPIFFILMAYHAFANVLLFYREALAHDLSPEHLSRDREEELASKLAVLEPVLRGTTALTPLGRALWEPLYERIHQRVPSAAA